MTQKQTSLSNKRSIRLIDWASLLLGFADAFWLYMSSSYLSEASGTENIGLFYGLVFLVVLGVFLTLHTWIHWLGKTTFLGVILFFLTVCMLVLAAIPTSFVGMLFLGGVIVNVSVAWVVLDIVLEDFSSDTRSGRIRGWYLTLINVGILAGPLIASRIVDRVGFKGVFLISGLAYAIVFLWVTLGLRSVNLSFKEKIVFSVLWRKIRSMPDVLRIYTVSFALELFFVVMIVYMPLRLLDLGFGWDKIGLIFTVMLIPFVLLQYPLGIIADTRWGEKELILIALILLGVSTGVAASSESHSFWFWMIVLFVTRVGAATIEVLRDAYFYKQIDGDDGDLIAFFRTARLMANILVAPVSSILLIWFPLSSVFWLSVIVSCIALGQTFSLRDTSVAVQ